MGIQWPEPLGLALTSFTAIYCIIHSIAFEFGFHVVRGVAVQRYPCYAKSSLYGSVKHEYRIRQHARYWTKSISYYSIVHVSVAFPHRDPKLREHRSLPQRGDSAEVWRTPLQHQAGMPPGGGLGRTGRKLFDGQQMQKKHAGSIQFNNFQTLKLSISQFHMGGSINW